MPVAVIRLSWVGPHAVGAAPIDVVQRLAAESRVAEVV